MPTFNMINCGAVQWMQLPEELARIIHHTREKPHTAQTEERASERAGTRAKSMLTFGVLGCQLAFFLAVCFTTQNGGLPQGTGPLPVIGEVCSSVAVGGE